MDIKRVVITGLGPVSPIGLGASTFAEAQRAGKSGVGPITHFDASTLRAQIAGEVHDDLSPYIEAREAKKLDRYVQLALAAAELAVKDSGISKEDLAGERTGTLVGSGIGGMKTFEDQAKLMVERGPSRISPLFIPMMIANMATGHVAMRFRGYRAEQHGGHRLRHRLGGYRRRLAHHPAGIGRRDAGGRRGSGHHRFEHRRLR